MTFYWKWFWRGMSMGVANVLPGISGGTIALLLGFYEEMLKSIKGIKLQTLIALGLGMVASILIGAKTVVLLLNALPSQTEAFLLGLVLASALVILKGTRERSKISVWVCFLVGLLGVFMFTGVSFGEGTAAISGFWYSLMVGAVASSAMLLPGISGATVLILFGYYQPTLEAVSNLDLAFLMPLGIGIVAGILGLAWILSYFLKRFANQTMAILAGMVFGSIRLLTPNTWSTSVLAAILIGFALVIYLDFALARRKY